MDPSLESGLMFGLGACFATMGCLLVFFALRWYLRYLEDI